MAGRYFGKFDPEREDRRVFGGRTTGRWSRVLLFVAG
jgi:hypothetical protein